MSACPMHPEGFSISEGRRGRNVARLSAYNLMLSGSYNVGVICVASTGQACFCNICFHYQTHQYSSAAGASVDQYRLQYQIPIETTPMGTHHSTFDIPNVVNVDGPVTYPSAASGPSIALASHIPVDAPSVPVRVAQPLATSLIEESSPNYVTVVVSEHQKVDWPASQTVKCPHCPLVFQVRPLDTANGTFGKHLQVDHGLPMNQKNQKWQCFWPGCVCQGKGLSTNERCQGYGQPHSAHVANPWIHLMKVHIGFTWVCKFGKVLKSCDALNSHIRRSKKKE